MGGVVDHDREEKAEGKGREVGRGEGYKRDGIIGKYYDKLCGWMTALRAMFTAPHHRGPELTPRNARRAN
jgi:hypothetical protein